jgi:hypothetical protein
MVDARTCEKIMTLGIIWDPENIFGNGSLKDAQILLA